MKEHKLKAYFEREMQTILQQSLSEPEGFRSYFTTHEPRDEEILCLLAISTMSPTFPLRHRFPTPLEALAALSGETRSEICQEFRRRLNTSPPA